MNSFANLKNTLYGDGINDDTDAIQEMIDSGVNEVSLPAPKVCYLISKPLELPSNFSFVLPRFAEIKLAKNSNCVMLKNKTQDQFAQRVEVPLWYYVNEYSSDFHCQNIEVKGGVWNCNNKEQAPNPLANNYDIRYYGGFGMLFYNVTNLTLSSFTIKNPVNFAMVIDKVEYFNVENIVFDFNDGNPDPGNMDGVHVCGNCHFGTIRNIKGATYDDLVALNADEGSCGEISNIEVNGLFAEDCHSAIRLLSANHPIKKIHISDVYGSYYQYCIGFTRYYPTKWKGSYEAVTVENVYASKAARYCCGYRTSPEGVLWKIVGPQKFAIGPDPSEYDPISLIWIDSDLHLKYLKISNLHRSENKNSVETIFISPDTEIEQLILENISSDNHTESTDMPLLINKGKVNYFKAENIFENGLKTEIIL